MLIGVRSIKLFYKKFQGGVSRLSQGFDRVFEACFKYFKIICLPTLKGWSHPAIRDSSLGAKSLAGFIAAPAVRPKLGREWVEAGIMTTIPSYHTSGG